MIIHKIRRSLAFPFRAVEFIFFFIAATFAIVADIVEGRGPCRD